MILVLIIFSVCIYFWLLFLHDSGVMLFDVQKMDLLIESIIQCTFFNFLVSDVETELRILEKKEAILIEELTSLRQKKASLIDKKISLNSIRMIHVSLLTLSLSTNFFSGGQKF